MHSVVSKGGAAPFETPAGGLRPPDPRPPPETRLQNGWTPPTRAVARELYAYLKIGSIGSQFARRTRRLRIAPGL